MSTTLPASAASFSFVREYPAADPADARRHFLARLAVETDPADLVVDLERGTGNLVVLDVRSAEDHARCRIPTARSLPHRQITRETTADLLPDALIVVYCWGPACNAATKAAARLAGLGFQVKELLGGLEYWRHEGCPIEGTLGADAPLHWSAGG